MNVNRKDIIVITERAMSWVVAMGMFVYGAGKYFQFGNSVYSELKVSELTSMQLMWSFYSHSFTFAIILGILEIFGGILILFKKTRLLGCLFLSAILANIILQDIFYKIPLGALVAALFYQMLIVLILWFNKERLIKAYNSLLLRSNHTYSGKKKYLMLFITIALFISLRLFEYFISIVFF